MAATNGRPKRNASECFDRQLPFDRSAECGLLGSLLLAPWLFAEIGLLVTAADFFDDANGKLFGLLSALVAEGKPLDTAIILDRLKTSGLYESIGGGVYLGKLINAVPNAAHCRWYAEIVADKATKRRVIQECTQLLADAYDDRSPSDELLTGIASASGRLSARATNHIDLLTLGEAAAEVIAGLERPGQLSAVNRAAWGLPSIDEDLGPIMPGEVCVIAARPGIGKTAFAQQVLRNSALRDRPAIVVSLEMTRAELAGRELARVTGVDSRDIRGGEINPEELTKLRSAQQDFSGIPLYIWSPPRATLGQIRGMVAHAVAKHGVRLAAIDFFQLIAGDSGSREDRRGQLAEISRGLKRLAKEFSLPLLVLSQINREGEKDNREPTIGMLRECGAIEEDADFVVFLHCSDPKADTTREFIARKVRGAPKGRRTLKWIGAKTEFADLDARDLPNFEPTFDAWNNP